MKIIIHSRTQRAKEALLKFSKNKNPLAKVLMIKEDLIIQPKKVIAGAIGKRALVHIKISLESYVFKELEKEGVPEHEVIIITEAT